MASTLLNERLARYVDAEKTILAGGQSYTIGNRILTRADLKQIRTEIDNLVAAGATLETTTTASNGSGRRSKQVLFRDFE